MFLDLLINIFVESWSYYIVENLLQRHWHRKIKGVKIVMRKSWTSHWILLCLLAVNVFIIKKFQALGFKKIYYLSVHSINRESDSVTSSFWTESSKSNYYNFSFTHLTRHVPLICFSNFFDIGSRSQPSTWLSEMWGSPPKYSFGPNSERNKSLTLVLMTVY